MNLVKPNFLVVSSGDSAVVLVIEMSMLSSDHVSFYYFTETVLDSRAVFFHRNLPFKSPKSQSIKSSDHIC